MTGRFHYDRDDDLRRMDGKMKRMSEKGWLRLLREEMVLIMPFCDFLKLKCRILSMIFFVSLSFGVFFSYARRSGFELFKRLLVY